MQISPKGIALIAKFEGFVSRPYLDAVKVPTIGYGTTFYPSGKKVSMRDLPITRARAEVYLKHYIDTIAIPAIERLVTVPLTQNQVDALCSFVYNLGSGALQKSTLLKKINAKRPKAEIVIEFRKWVMAGGKVLPGLVKRRIQEADLFIS